MRVCGCRLEVLKWLLFQVSVHISARQVRLAKLDGHFRIPTPFLEVNSSGDSSVEHWIPDQIVKKSALANKNAEQRQASGFVRWNVVWVHIHKYAGTWMCYTAKTQGEVVGPSNCNWPGDGCMGHVGQTNPTGEAEPHNASCAEREASPTITFSMIERPLEAGDLACKKALRGLIVRSPQAAVKSLASFEGISEEMLVSFLRVARNEPAGFFRRPGEQVWYRELDNFMVRTLSGDFYAPVGRLTQKHLDDAKYTLHQMDVIIPLENLTDHIVQLEKVFRWDPSKIDASERRNKGGDDGGKRDYVPSYSAWVLNEIEKLNSLDSQLYSLALDLAEERSRTLRAGSAL